MYAEGGQTEEQTIHKVAINQPSSTLNITLIIQINTH
jgi:hypothetical protein